MITPPEEKITFKEMHDTKAINWEAVAHRMYGFMVSEYEAGALKKICPEIYYRLNPIMVVGDNNVESFGTETL